MNSPQEPPPPPPPVRHEPGQLPTYSPYAYPPLPTNGKATASMVLGIVGVTLCPILVPSILAIIFGVIAKREIDEAPGMQGKGQAQAGFILGIVGIALCVVAIIFYVAIIAGFAIAVDEIESSDYKDGYYYDSYSALLTSLSS